MLSFPFSRLFFSSSIRIHGSCENDDRQADTNEIVSILGHELGHWKMSHTLQGFVITQSYLLASFCAFGLAMELGESLRLSFGYSTSATLITLYLFFAVVRERGLGNSRHPQRPDYKKRGVILSTGNARIAYFPSPAKNYRQRPLVVWSFLVRVMP